MNKTTTAFMLMCLHMVAATGYSQWSTYLHDNVVLGRLDVVKALVADGVDVNAKDKEGWTMLHVAAFEGQSEVAQFFVAKGVDVNSINTNGTTPLMLAALAGYPGAAQVLIDKGADVNARSFASATPLMFAANKGNLEVVKSLVAKGADVNARTENGVTSLMLALDQSYQATADYLVAKGADVNNQNKQAIQTAFRQDQEYQRISVQPHQENPANQRNTQGDVSVVSKIMEMNQQAFSDINTQYNAAFDQLGREQNMMTHEKFNKAWSSLEKERDEAIRKSKAVCDNMVKTINGGVEAEPSASRQDQVDGDLTMQNPSGLRIEKSSFGEAAIHLYPPIGADGKVDMKELKNRARIDRRTGFTSYIMQEFELEKAKNVNTFPSDLWIKDFSREHGVPVSGGSKDLFDSSDLSGNGSFP